MQMRSIKVIPTVNNAIKTAKVLLLVKQGNGAPEDTLTDSFGEIRMLIHADEYEKQARERQAREETEANIQIRGSEEMAAMYARYAI